jgi:hypothetical protein
LGRVEGAVVNDFCDVSFSDRMGEQFIEAAEGGKTSGASNRHGELEMVGDSVVLEYLGGVF